jgi:hypothetical protein
MLLKKCLNQAITFEKSSKHSKIYEYLTFRGAHRYFHYLAIYGMYFPNS